MVDLAVGRRRGGCLACGFTDHVRDAIFFRGALPSRLPARPVRHLADEAKSARLRATSVGSDIVDRAERIFVAGHHGLVGSAIVRRLQSDGYRNLLLRSRSELDL